MSEQNANRKTSKQKKLAQIFIVLAVGLIGFGYWFSTWPSYWLEQRRVQKEVIDRDHVANDQQLGIDIKAARRDRSKHGITMADIENDRNAVIPAGIRAHSIDDILKEFVAAAEGQLRSHPEQYLPGNRPRMATVIPIYGCMLVVAKGKIWRGDEPTAKEIADGRDKPAGPDGEDYSHNDLHKYKDTVIPDAKWGAFIGQSCSDTKGEDCGPEFVIGSASYISPRLAGKSGTLFVGSNGYKYFRKFDLTGPPRTPSYTDWNIVQGGFNFGWAPATSDRCDVVTTLASR